MCKKKKDLQKMLVLDFVIYKTCCTERWVIAVKGDEPKTVFPSRQCLLTSRRG